MAKKNKGFYSTREYIADFLTQTEADVSALDPSNPDEAEKALTLYEKAYDYAFEYAEGTELVFMFIDFLYERGDMDRALEVAKTLYESLKETGDRFSVERVCDKIEYLVEETGADEEALLEDIMFSRMY